MGWIRLNEFGVEELNWPAFLDELKQSLKARCSYPTAISDLIDAVLEECSEIRKEAHIQFAESLPRRVEAVNVAKGGLTSY